MLTRNDISTDRSFRLHFLRLIELPQHLVDSVYADTYIHVIGRKAQWNDVPSSASLSRHISRIDKAASAATPSSRGKRG